MTPTAAAAQISYDDLYARWERSNWRATEIDFSKDVEDWRALSDFERRAALWSYALFFHGEDVVATDLAPFVDAAPLEEQRYFLATQQVDEARHSVFFKRFMEEVAGFGADDGTVGGALDRTRDQLTWGWRKTFAILDRVTGELRRDRSATALAQAVAMYHFVVEASLAQPGQHFIQGYLEKRGIMPAFAEGMRNVALDEQRHIAFGVRLLYDLAQQDPAVPAAVADILREATPYTVSLFIPPGFDRRYTEVFGFTLEEIFEEGARSLDSKLRAAGMPLDDLPGPKIMPTDLPYSEQAIRGIELVRVGILGEGDIPPDPQGADLLFDTMRRAVDHRKAPGRAVILQWDFKDAAPWHLRVDNGSSAAASGLVDDADLTFRCRYADWVDVVGGRAEPLRLVATGKLRPKGSLRALALLPRLFPRY